MALSYLMDSIPFVFVSSLVSLLRDGYFFLSFLMCIFRIMVAIMTGIGILWIPVVQSVQGGQLFLYIQAVSAYFSPPIAALYLIAILWTKATEKVCCNAFLSCLQRVSIHTKTNPCLENSPQKLCIETQQSYFSDVVRYMVWENSKKQISSCVSVLDIVNMENAFYFLKSGVCFYQLEGDKSTFQFAKTF